MKKKLAFIDYHIDEWHANNYPAWIKASPLADDFELLYGWEESAQPEGRPLEKWCQDFGLTPVKSIDEIVEKADCMFVLAPSNPEVHERLAQVPLASGKPVYIDKPFAPDLATAERIVERAAKYGTPLMSSSALRFANELMDGKIKAQNPGVFTTTGGGSSYHEYAIHQLEMIVSVMGTEVEKINCIGNRENAAVVLEYSQGRIAQLSYKMYYPFSVTACSEAEGICLNQLNNFFPNLLTEILRFFKSGVSPINIEETLKIAELLGKTVAEIEK